jgi:hypothetical protein
MTVMQGLSARSAVRGDVSASQGPRDDALRACKTARRVAFRALWWASAPLDDVPHRLRVAFYPEGTKRRSDVSSSYDGGH